MNLNQLKIFYLAAKKGNLSLAAQELFITQPAVTKGIQRLPEFYEMKFVDHIGKKLVLTDAGEVLYEIAEKIFELESQAEESIRDFQHCKRGHSRILSSESFGDYYLPHIIILFSIALISRKVAREEIQAGRLRDIPLSNPAMTRKFYLIHHKDKYVSESLQGFIDMVFKWAGEYAEGLV
jgi:DNA-binding transcriptional LysR family regulator